jgi:hypothetical protein
MKYLPLLLLASCTATTSEVVSCPPEEQKKHQIECVLVNVGKNEVCDIQECDAVIDTLSVDNIWTGRFSCQDGYYENMQGQLGDWVGVDFERNLGTYFYAIKVTPEYSVGQVRVQLVKN